MEHENRPAAGSDPPVISATRLTVRYGPHTALEDVSVDFHRGATGLLGNNGAGKSSLIQTILGLVVPDVGDIRVMGVDARAHPRDARMHIGYVPERDVVLPDFTAVGSVAYCGELAGLPGAEATSRAHDMLSFVGLDDTRYRDAATLSTGMRQRLKLAQALVHDPDILLLDEPTNGLDPRGREQMLDLIDRLVRRAGVSIIFSSHLLPDIERTCDACVILDHGRIVAADRLGAWRSMSEVLYEIRLKGDELAFVAALYAEGLRTTVDGELLLVAGASEPRRLFAIAQRTGVQIRHLRRRLETLDAFFERVTKGA